MKMFIPVICALLIMLSASDVIAQDKNLKSHSSDMVGIKLDYPSDWTVDDYSWGFTLNDPASTASISVQVYFMPAELENAYDVNLNPEEKDRLSPVLGVLL